MDKALHFERYFASYSSKDRDAVIQAVNLLRTTGADLFIDFITLRGGDEWELKIADAILTSQKFYLFWSKNAKSSKWVDRELNLALQLAQAHGLKDFIVPIRLDDTPLPPTLSSYHSVTLSLVGEGTSLGFVTEKIRTTTQGFDIQFSLTNPNREGQLNIFEIVPIVFFTHYKILYYPGYPRRLANTTLRALRQMRDQQILQSAGGSLFIGLPLLEEQFYRLAPGEIETFSTLLLADMNMDAIYALGFVVKFTDYQGQQHARTSDVIFVVSKDDGRVDLAKYDLTAVVHHLDDIHNYNFNETVIASIHYEGIYELYGGIEPDWKQFLQNCLAFLQLRYKIEDIHIMAPVPKSEASVIHPRTGIEGLKNLVDSAIRESRWISWSAFRRHLEVSSDQFSRLYDPFTFIMVQHYVRGYLSEIIKLVQQLDAGEMKSASDLLNDFITQTFLNHLLDCYWAAYILDQDLSKLARECRRKDMVNEMLYKRIEYLQNQWNKMEDGQTEDSPEFVAALRQIKGLS